MLNPKTHPLKRNEGYLVTTYQRGHARPIIWHAEHPTLIHEHGWYMERTASGTLQLAYKVPKIIDQRTQMVAKKIYILNAKKIRTGEIFTSPIPCPATGGSLSPSGKPQFIQLSVRSLPKSRPAFMPNKAHSRDLSSGREDYYLYSGIRYYLNDSQFFKKSYLAEIDGNAIFRITLVGGVFQINPLQKNLIFKTHGAGRKALSPGVMVPLSPQQFAQGSLQLGKFWWRINTVSNDVLMNQALLAEAADSPSVQDQRNFLKITQTIFASLLFMGLALNHWSKKTPPSLSTQTVDLTQLPIAQPKLLPPVPKPLPTPVRRPPPLPPKPKPLPKPQPPKPAPKPPKAPPAPPKPPKPQVPQPRRPVTPPRPARPRQQPTPPQPIRRAPPATRAPVTPRRPPPQAVVSRPVALPPGPTAAQLKQQQNQQVQANLLKTLGFLSASKNHPSSTLPPPSQDTAARFQGPAGGGSALGRNSRLKDLTAQSSEEGSDDATTSLHNSRNISSGSLSRGKIRGEGVRGKITLPHASGGGALGASLRAQLTLSGPGQLSESAIEKALSKHMDQLQFCYEKALLTDATLAGSVSLEWVIQTSGSASQLKVVRSQLNNGSLHSCLMGVIAKIQFPAPKGGPVTISYPFSFNPNG